MSILLEDSGYQIPTGRYIERPPTPEEEEAIRIIAEAGKKRKIEAEQRKTCQDH